MVDDYLRQYGLVAIYTGVAVAVPAGVLLLSWLSGLVGMRPRRPNSMKYTTYECGMTPVGNPRVQFNFRYYVIALLFVAFDVIAVFLYPWAVQFSRLGGFALIAIAVFVAILLVGWVYAWRKGALEWE